MIEVLVFIMYLITITDIENPNVEVHRLVFDNHAECIALATAINQVRDPIVNKKNCRSVIKYYYNFP